MPNGFFLNRLELSSSQINSPRLSTRQIQRSDSCPDLRRRPIANSFTLDSLNVSKVQVPKNTEPETEPEPTDENDLVSVTESPPVISPPVEKICFCAIL